MKNLTKHHNKHIKEVYGENCFNDKDFNMNYGWSTDDGSITTKIYNKKGHQYLTTYFILGKYVYDCGKL